MTYGIQCFNDSGELTFSSDAYLLAYLGKATYVSTTAAGTDPVGSFGSFMTFTFTYAGPITCAVGLLSTGTSGSTIDGMSNSGSTWTITVWCADSTGNTLGFPGQVTTADVYVFGVPLSVSGYGFCINDASGSLAADLLKKPLLVRARPSFASSVLSVSIPAMTKPAVLGGGGALHQQTSAANTPTTGRFTNRIFREAWLWDSTHNTLIRNPRMHEYFVDDGGIPAVDVRPAASTILIEASGLT